MAHLSFPSPLGPLTLIEADGAITALTWGDRGGATETPLLRQGRDEIAAYFAGRLRRFTLPLTPAGTPFQRRVWATLAEIPFGQTRSYGDLARELGSGPRAVGGACGRNPIPLLIPCHRVLTADGHLGGYSGQGGLVTKMQLLRHEGAIPPEPAGPG
ncbi:MAG: hypothetical protein RLZZ501_923 [Pseudomonadota bacterium]